ncbi:MAG: peptide MFS transporter, partial [Muribaculum sp.]|nr:peptide MFS transporter [Muribaculum sp.]
MFKNQPKGLYVLALANTGERFGYYTMIAILLLFLQAKFAFSTATAGLIYSTFLALVYFMPIIGGWVADKWNFSKTVTLGIAIMFLGYGVLAYPTPRMETMSMITFFAGLLFISVGTGLFKGNLQVMVGDLYNNPKYESKRDVAFSLFYMAINIGAMFAPGVSKLLCSTALENAGFAYNSALPSICNKVLAGDTLTAEASQTIADIAAQHGLAVNDFAVRYMEALSTGYSWAFAVACGSMVLSFLIYKLGRSTYASVTEKQTAATANGNASHTPELTKEQTRSRIVALMLVFAVVIFFWMVFHQNGVTLTKYAEVFTQSSTSSWTHFLFNVWSLAGIVVLVYALFSTFQSTGRSRIISGIVSVAAIALLVWYYGYLPAELTDIQPQEYQQFNPFYVVALTPFSVALFGWLGRKGKEPSAPRKIGMGMIVAAIAFAFIMIASFGLGVAPEEGVADTLVSPNVLITTYLFLTFAELLLSPMGISFVSKVAPPKYKGMMMGCWFGATAIGNYLVFIP